MPTDAQRRNLASAHHAEVQALNERIAELTAENTRLEGLVYTPGLWRCAKCNFVLVQRNLNANSGTITARDQPGDKCPNCDVNLWRITERENARDNYETAERLHIELNEAKGFIALLEQQLAESKRQMESQKNEWLAWDAKRMGLELDAVRLDYMHSTGSTIELLPGHPDFYPMNFRIGGLHEATGPSLRAAIDAAIAAQEQP